MAGFTVNGLEQFEKEFESIVKRAKKDSVPLGALQGLLAQAWRAVKSEANEI